MHNTKPISNNRIIFFVSFVCASIIASLFVFHTRQTTNDVHSPLSAEQGLLFSNARDIKSFELANANGAVFTQQNLRDHWTLLFFGFTHCKSICPTTLQIMQQSYKQLEKDYPQLQIVMVSLDPERDTLQVLNDYVHSFNPSFIGVSGKMQELRKLQSQFGVYSAKESEDSNYQIQHTASIMLINPQGKWVGFYRFGMNPEQLSNAIKTSIAMYTSSPNTQKI